MKITKYIEREKIGLTDFEIAMCNCDYKEAFKMLNEKIDSIPATDVRPVVRGKWKITDAYPHNVYCSECHKKFAQTHWTVWEDGSLPRNFCPNCGADMREEN